MVNINEKEVTKLGIEIIESDFVKIHKGYVRHDEDKLAATLLKQLWRKNYFMIKRK